MKREIFWRNVRKLQEMHSEKFIDTQMAEEILSNCPINVNMLCEDDLDNYSSEDLIKVTSELTLELQRTPTADEVIKRMETENGENATFQVGATVFSVSHDDLEV